MHDYLEKAVAFFGGIIRKALSLSDIELAFFLGVFLGGSLWYIASYIASLLEERKRKKFFRIEKELFGIQKNDGTVYQGGKPEMDSSRRKSFWDDPPKRTTVEDRTDHTGKEAERKKDEEGEHTRE